MTNDQPSDIGAFVAGLVAPKDRAVTFFWLTLLVLGPLGVLAASIAQPRDPLYDAARKAHRTRPATIYVPQVWCGERHT